MSIHTNLYSEGHDVGYERGKSDGYKQGYDVAQKAYMEVIRKYQGFLARLGIKYDPFEKEEGED